MATGRVPPSFLGLLQTLCSINFQSLFILSRQTKKGTNGAPLVPFTEENPKQKAFISQHLLPP